MQTIMCLIIVYLNVSYHNNTVNSRGEHKNRQTEPTPKKPRKLNRKTAPIEKPMGGGYVFLKNQMFGAVFGFI